MTTSKQRDFWKCLCEIQSKCSFCLDFAFYRLGKLIGTRPVTFLLLSLAICLLSSLGLILWKEEVDEIQLFMPKDSIIRQDASWVEEHFRDELRFESVIVEADNVLTPPVLTAIADLETAVRGIVASGHDWSDVCARYLTWFPNVNESSAIAEIHEYMEDFQDNCIYQSMLRIWTQNGTMDPIYKLDQHEIIRAVSDAVNGVRKKNGQKFTSVLENVKPLLAGITKDSKGNVVGAKATILNWILKKTNKWSPDWELEFIKTVLFSNRTLPPGIKIYAVTTRSYEDTLAQVLENNITLLFAGFSLIIFYVMIMLGRFNIIEQRLYLSLLGVSIVGQAIMSSYGASFYMGFFWGPIHPVLPFLLLGIGVDNIFLIMQCLDNLNKEDNIGDVPERMGRVLRQAGVSITVTSFTDIVAFAVGTTTIMPFLRSFCVFASMGIFFLYLFGILFFMSCLTIDERRLQENREGCLCSVQTNWKPNECSKRDLQKEIFEKYIGPMLMKTPVKVCVIVITVIVFALNIWFVFKVEQKFDPVWYLDPESYPLQYSNKLNEYFPEYGKRAAVYLGSDINYYDDKDKLIELYSCLKENKYINHDTLEFWYTAFQDWLKEHYPSEDISNEEELKSYLFEFLLMSPSGQKYIKDLKFSNFPFGEFNITASEIELHHKLIDTTTEQVKAMQSIKEIIKSVNLTSEHIVSYSPQYVSWTANQIIGGELLRNLGLSICVIATVTAMLIQNLQASFWVLCCVIFIVTDLVGSMYWLNLTIEISSSIMILLCAGLAVDYSSHIANEFTRISGTRDERAVEALGQIGSAVFNGGLSTFLAFVLLGGSTSYLFTTFFKLFTALVVFGLFHGLVFLPVILSLFGPPSRKMPQNKFNQRKKPFECQNGYYQGDAVNLEDATPVTEPLKSGLQDDRDGNHISTPNV